MNMPRVRFAALLFPLSLFAQTITNPPPPRPVPMPPPIVVPVDQPYAGPIQLDVDLTNVRDRVAHVHESIPVPPKAKELVLLYPQWIPGAHSPVGTISRIAGIVTSVDGKRVQWIRDQINVYAFHVPLGAGARTVDLEFDYLSPIKSAEGRIEWSDAIVDLAWNEVAMYPAGFFSRDIPFDVTLKLPQGWKYATALETASSENSALKFKRTTLNTLVDSPLYGGIHFKQVDLSPSKTNIVRLNVFGDEEKDLAISADALEKHKNLAIEADKLYQSHHYEHYDFLLLLSSTVGGVGLEHHQSSEDGSRPNYFTEWDRGALRSDLLPHEYTHSWNGKFRRPADLWTPNFNVPMRDDLLWIYEGMTQYWGNVLAARSGIRTPEQARYGFARVAAGFEVSPGRGWRPLVDTTNQPTVSERRPMSWGSWQLGENYYTEGALIWLDADTKLRELTNDRKSLDDFAAEFFGPYNGSFVTLTYDLHDVVEILNRIAPYDWMKFFQERVYTLHPVVPTEGFTRGGYRLAYSDKIPSWLTRSETAATGADFSTSLGFSVGGGMRGEPAAGASSNALGNVGWNTPAFNAGITPDMQIVSVNGKTYTAQVLRDAITEAEKSRKPIELQFRRGDEYKTYSIPYYDGLRIPTLERVDGTPDRLDEILAPSKRSLPAM
ncbi:MAG TPA: peptidase M61 [Thermoanaerobaculia bacterium]|jgi:predicted metalloprotease with PDZ domain|nr:peptidase M61 [Thermoanaerobaculia bacterium]